MWRLTKNTSRPFHPDLADTWDWPNTVTFFVGLRMKYDSFLELSEVPPEEHWDFPHLIDKHIEKLYPHIKKASTVDLNLEELEN